MLYDAGVDVKSAQYFMGHSNLETTLKIYTHLSKFRTTKSIASFNSHVRKMIKKQYNEEKGGEEASNK